MSARGWIDRASGALPVLAPFLVVTVVPAAPTVSVAACWALGLAPGVLWADRLLERDAGPPDRLRRLAFAVVLALLVFGLPATIAGRLHASFTTFLWTYATAWVAASVAAVIGPRATRPAPVVPEVRPRAAWSRPIPVAIVAGAVLSLVGYLLAARTTGAAVRWPLFGGTGVASALALFVLARRRPRDERPEGPSAHGRPSARGVELAAWIAIVALTGFLARVAHTTSEVPLDDVTHVSRAVDFLAGGELDRFEPSLAEGLPLDPEFTGPTTALLVATVAHVTGLECAAVAHTWLPPFVVLFAVAALAALFTTLVRADRELVPIALLGALAVVAHSGDTHRSLTAFVVERALLPKATHLALCLPLQLATLVEVTVRPSRRALVLALVVTLTAHLVHPWGTVLAALWWSAALLWALLFRRRAWRPLAALGLAIALFGTAQKLTSVLGPEQTVTRTPTVPIELELDGERARRLDVDATLGEDRLLKLGVAFLPWLLLLSVLLPEFGVVFACGVVALACAYASPLFELQAWAIPRSILWRTRWAVPSLACAGGFAVVCALAAASCVRPRRRPLALATGAAVLPLALFVGDAEARFELGPPFERSTKLHAPAHALAEHFGAARATLLAPIPPAAHVAAELCQLAPNVRTLVTTAHVVRWYAGDAEFQRRAALIEAFYQGRLGATEYRLLVERYGVDHALVDASYGRTARQRTALATRGWTRVATLERFELWRKP